MLKFDYLPIVYKYAVIVILTEPNKPDYNLMETDIGKIFSRNTLLNKYTDQCFRFTETQENIAHS